MKFSPILAVVSTRFTTEFRFSGVRQAAGLLCGGVGITGTSAGSREMHGNGVVHVDMDDAAVARCLSGVAVGSEILALPLTRLVE